MCKKYRLLSIFIPQKNIVIALSFSLLNFIQYIGKSENINTPSTSRKFSGSNQNTQKNSIKLLGKQPQTSQRRKSIYTHTHIPPRSALSSPSTSLAPKHRLAHNAKERLSTPVQWQHCSSCTTARRRHNVSRIANSVFFFKVRPLFRSSCLSRYRL